MTKRGSPFTISAVMSPSGDGQPDSVVKGDFATRLRDTASAIGLNAARLASLCGVRRGTMARYWHGERAVPADLLFKLADVLEVDARWLFNGQEMHGASLSGEERRLIESVRRLDKREQQAVMDAAFKDELPDVTPDA